MEATHVVVGMFVDSKQVFWFAGWVWFASDGQKRSTRFSLSFSFLGRSFLLVVVAAG
jgi:hypothetical protein